MAKASVKAKANAAATDVTTPVVTFTGSRPKDGIVKSATLTTDGVVTTAENIKLRKEGDNYRASWGDFAAEARVARTAVRALMERIRDNRPIIAPAAAPVAEEAAPVATVTEEAAKTGRKGAKSKGAKSKGAGKGAATAAPVTEEAAPVATVTEEAAPVATVTEEAAPVTEEAATTGRKGAKSKGKGKGKGSKRKASELDGILSGLRAWDGESEEIRRQVGASVPGSEDYSWVILGVPVMGADGEPTNLVIPVVQLSSGEAGHRATTPGIPGIAGEAATMKAAAWELSHAVYAALVGAGWSDATAAPVKEEAAPVAPEEATETKEESSAPATADPVAQRAAAVAAESARPERQEAERPSDWRVKRQAKRAARASAGETAGTARNTADAAIERVNPGQQYRYGVDRIYKLARRPGTIMSSGQLSAPEKANEIRTIIGEIREAFRFLPVGDGEADRNFLALAENVRVLVEKHAHHVLALAEAATGDPERIAATRPYRLPQRESKLLKVKRNKALEQLSGAASIL